MAMVNVVTIAAYRRIYWLRPIGLVQRSAATWLCVLHSSDEPGELSQWQRTAMMAVPWRLSWLLLLLFTIMLIWCCDTISLVSGVIYKKPAQVFRKNGIPVPQTIFHVHQRYRKIMLYFRSNLMCHREKHGKNGNSSAVREVCEKGELYKEICIAIYFSVQHQCLVVWHNKFNWFIFSVHCIAFGLINFCSCAICANNFEWHGEKCHATDWHRAVTKLQCGLRSWRQLPVNKNEKDSRWTVKFDDRSSNIWIQSGGYWLFVVRKSQKCQNICWPSM